jgi:A/G-specific adenine glycosylase
MSQPASRILLAPLAEWFSANRRDLPWRARDLDSPHPDPYAVLVSELMLQQTQVATVIPYFHRWMARFPDPPSLAAATEDEVHKAWEGLGYYRRARYLQRTAERIAQAGWPGDLEGLLALPGLGPYTAAAVASIAFLWPEPALDGNAFRVLARLLALEGDPRRSQAMLRDWLRPALAALGPSRITQGLMELGATHCAPKADCAPCPLRSACAAHGAGLEDRIPPPAPRATVKHIGIHLVAVEAGERFFLQEPARTGLLAGLWRWPAVELPEPPEPAGDSHGVRTWKGWTQVYTHRREAVTPVAITLPAPFPPPPGHAWVTREALLTLPLGRRDQRLRDLLGEASQGDPSGVPAHRLLARIRGASGD